MAQVVGIDVSVEQVVRSTANLAVPGLGHRHRHDRSSNKLLRMAWARACGELFGGDQGGRGERCELILYFKRRSDSGKIILHPKLRPG